MITEKDIDSIGNMAEDELKRIHFVPVIIENRGTGSVRVMRYVSLRQAVRIVRKMQSSMRTRFHWDELIERSKKEKCKCEDKRWAHGKS